MSGSPGSCALTDLDTRFGEKGAVSLGGSVFGRQDDERPGGAGTPRCGMEDDPLSFPSATGQHDAG